MVRRLTAIGVRLVPVALLAVLAAGCGGDSKSEVSVPPPPPPPGSVFSGTVSAPNGQVALLAPSALQRLAGLVVSRAEALYSTNVRAVGRNVGVLLSILGGGGGVTQTFGTGYTNDQGAYQQTLPPGTSQDTCRFMVSVGTLGEGTLTRAFVYSLVEPINIDFNTEAAVAVILGRVQQGVSLCEFSSQEIKGIVAAIQQLPENITADNVFETNRNATIAAASSEEIQLLLDIASGQVALPTATRPVAATPTVPQQPTNTAGPAPTSTFTRTPVPTNTPRAATPTFSPAPPTNTRPPATATNTARPTNTSGPTNTPRPTNTPLPPTATHTPPKTPPAVSIGSVSGAPGAQVTLPFSLAMNSYQVTTIAPLVVGFDPGIVSFNACVSKVSGKAVDAGVPTDEPDRLRIVMEGGLSVIPDGLIIDCTFTIATGTEPGPMVVTFERAGMSDANLTQVEATGSDGTITVTAGGLPTATPTSPAPATPTATATPTVGGGERAINLDSVSGAPGATVSIAATLVNGGGVVVATSNDITYDSTKVNVLLKPNGKPDCTINLDIGPDSVPGKNLSTSQPTSPATAKILRIGVLSTENVNVIPDGQLFTCKFMIADAAAAGAVTLDNVPRASDAASNLVPVVGADGTITVTGSTGGPAINLNSVSGAAGATVTITATLANSNQAFAATSNDIVYDSTQVNVLLKPNGKPDCTINLDIGPDSVPGKNLSTSQPTSPPAMKILRVGVLSTENVNVIPDGLLFSCKFQIAAGASPGAKVLDNIARASDPASVLTELGGTDGTITVQ